MLDKDATPDDGDEAKAAMDADEVILQTRTGRVTHVYGSAIVFPSLNIRRPLPLNEPVVVELTPSSEKEISFACGMNMLRGSVVVQ